MQRPGGAGRLSQLGPSLIYVGGCLLVVIDISWWSTRSTSLANCGANVLTIGLLGGLALLVALPTLVGLLMCGLTGSTRSSKVSLVAIGVALAVLVATGISAFGVIRDAQAHFNRCINSF